MIYPIGYSQLEDLTLVVTDAAAVQVIIPGTFRAFFLLFSPAPQPISVVVRSGAVTSATKLLADQPLPLGPYRADQTLFLRADGPGSQTIQITPWVSESGEISDMPPYRAVAGPDLAPLWAAILALQGDVTTLQGQMTTVQGDVGILQGQMTTAQADIAALQLQIEQRPAGLNGVFGHHMRINWPFMPAVTIEPDASADGLIYAFCGDRMGNGRIVSFSAAITGDLSASGVNGLDVGSFAPVKVYVWRLIVPATGPGVALLASLSGATPILPPGYDYWSDIVCPVVTGPAPDGDVYECCHSRGGRNCFEFDVPNLGGIPILSNGVATAKTAIGQIRALSTIFPAERREGEIQLYYEAQNNSGTIRTASVYNLDNAVYSLRGRQIGLAATPGEREQAAGNFLCLIDGATIDTSLWYDWSGAPTGGLSLWVDKIWI